MTQEKLQELHSGLETAYINETVASNLAYRPQFVSNNYKEGKKVLSSIEDELLACDQFQISVAFITLGALGSDPNDIPHSVSQMEKDELSGMSPEVVGTYIAQKDCRLHLCKVNSII